MTTIELARLVHEMREAQKAYFRDRRQGDLTHSKELERQLDKTVKTILQEQPAMLPGLGGGD